MAKGKKLSDAYVELRAEDSKLGADVKVSATKAARGFGAQLNRQLAAMKIDPIDIKADPKSAVAAIEATRARLKAMSRDAESVEVRVRVERAISQLDKFRKQIGDLGGDGAKGFSAQFAARVGPLLARTPLSPHLLLAIGAATPAVSAALSTAVAVGAAGGAVALGAALSAKDPRVAAGIESLKRVIGDELEEATTPFAPAMLNALDDAKAGVRSLRPELDAVFAKASTYLDPLAEGLIGFVRNAVPGLAQVVDAAEPLVDILGDELPELGDDFAKTLQALAESAARNDEEFRAILDTLGLITVQIGHATTAMDYLAAGPTRSFLDLLSKARDEGADGILFVQNAADDAAESFATAADALRSFRTEVDKLIGDQLDLEEATIGWQAAIDATTAAAKENGKTLDLNTAKGRANREALLSQARAGLDYADAVYEERAALGDLAGAEAAAEAAYQKSRAALVKSAQQFGRTKAEAEAYVTEVLGIPPTRNTRADFIADNAGVTAWKKTLSGIPREIFTSARLRAIVDLEVRREQATSATGRRHGGIDYVGAGAYAAAAGGIARVWPASNPPLVKFAEPETGGEAWIPRLGDRDRALAILAEAAAWHDATVVPAARGMIAADMGAARPLPAPARSGAVGAAAESWPAVLIAEQRQIAGLLRALLGATHDNTEAVVGLPPGLAATLLGRGLSPQLTARMR